MSQLTVIESFDGKPVEFHTDDAFVNLTTMCAAYGKRPNDFLALPSTKRFIKALSEDAKQLPENLVIAARGSKNGGTWAHPDLALECARWLSPKFAIWCNRTIRKILAGQQPADKSPADQIAELTAQIARLQSDAYFNRRGQHEHEIVKLTAPIGQYGELNAKRQPKRGLVRSYWRVTGDMKAGAEISFHLAGSRQLTLELWEHTAKLTITQGGKPAK